MIIDIPRNTNKNRITLACLAVLTKPVLISKPIKPVSFLVVLTSILSSESLSLKSRGITYYKQILYRGIPLYTVNIYNRFYD